MDIDRDKPAERLADDGELVRAVLAGDRSAYGVLYDRYVALIEAVCFDCTGDVDEAQDLCQEAFLLGFERLDRLRKPDRYHPKQYNAMYLPPEDPLRHERRLARLVGLEWELLQRDAADTQWRTDANGHKLESAEQAWEVVRASVDAGKPVQATFMDDYILIGCQDADKPEKRRVYSVGGWDPPCWWDWGKFENYVKVFGRFSRPGGRVEPAPPHEVALEVIRGMVQYWRNDARKALPWLARGEGKYGAEGLEAYADDTANMEMKPGDFDGGWLGCHCVYRQITGRPAAAEYLRGVAGELPAPGEDLRKAAGHCDAAWQHWLEWGRQLGEAGGVTKAKEIAGLWADPKRRAAGAQAVRAAAARERSAWESPNRFVATA